MSVAYEEHVGPWTVDEVLALPEDSRVRIELVGGALMMSPSPGTPHQRASTRLLKLLDRAVEAAEAPVEIFHDHNVIVSDGLLIPDIVIADAEGAAQATIHLEPRDVLAVIEIASPSTQVTDRKMKPVLYAAAGIPSYWRVELAPTPRIHVGELGLGGAYAEVTVQAGTRTQIKRPFPFEIDPADLLLRR
ncbi:Uma2 family endonuclease [Streptomyces hainanensis]|uniref:Uma2 family endonuclease n=1 Tax=Streptomyces hainanensis TaxID=402648 RepID=A0A4R4SSE0_9ACTN|nr:Uma2 family endonuclease [Streptomyces hainanensis]TDC65149.1 Uma2 family endonuclease [Streptomyces hainanensis]